MMHYFKLNHSRFFILLCCLFAALPNCLVSEQAQAQASKANNYQISEVVIDGAQRIDPAALKIQLGKTKGEISRDEISSGVKSLFATGFFEQVTASLVDLNSKTALKYSVIEKPVVRKVFIKGNKGIQESELAEVFSFDARRFMDKGKVEAMIRQASSLYQSQGYYDVSFTYSVVPVGENQIDLTFQVEEGERYKIRRISIRGLKTIDPDDLRDVMVTKRYKWWSSWLLGTGRLNTEALESDKGALRQYFLDHGLLEATVTEPNIEKLDDGLALSFEVDEGEVFKIGRVSAKGDLIEQSMEETLKGIETEPGDIFSASTLREDSFKISEKYADKGYAFANVVPNTMVDRSAHAVDLEFGIDQGKPVTINEIKIRGNDKTYDNVIRREIRVNEQELFSGSKIRRSQELLQRLGYFEEVGLTTEPVSEDKVDLNVNVREGSTGSFSAGAGYSSSDGALFNSRLSENNLFGTGRRGVLNVDIGTLRDSYILTFEDNRINDTFLQGGIDLYRTDRRFNDFDRRLTGSSLRIGYPVEEIVGEWGQDISTDLKYEYFESNIDNVDRADAAQLVIDSEGKSQISALTPRIIRNTINNPLNPTKGSRQELSLELAGAGGSEQYYLLEARNTLYYPLVDLGSGELTFSWRTSIGYGDSFDNDPFPLFRRYFPGGINSIRGYKVRSLGPKDSRGNEFGGSKELINNLELIFPLVNSAGLKGVTFFDLGEAFDDNESIDLGGLRRAYGFGLRWSSPLGPIRIEFGIPIGRKDGEDPLVTMFSFGAPL